ncbi:MAG: DUF1786 family protein [Candidatus Odinarchaeota archaeon]
MFLGIDTGQGTTDILLWDQQSPLENALQFVIPSASSRLARRISSTDGDIYCHGNVMGGIPLVKVLKEKIQAGSQVFMTKEAAMSIRYHPDFVEAIGIKILEPETPPPENVTSFITGDFDFPWLLGVFEEALGEKPAIDQVGLAVQDHGLHEKTRLARETRLEFYKERLLESKNLLNLGFREGIPSRFPRLRAAWLEKEKALPNTKHFIIDTSPAAIIGALQDEQILQEQNNVPKTVINFGNGHTLVCIISASNEVIALFEHHTGRIKQPGKFDSYLKEFFTGKLSSKKVIEDHGHGVYYLGSVPSESSENIVAIGPNRSLGKESAYEMVYANPGGSMMMAGPIAMAKALEEEELER